MGKKFFLSYVCALILSVLGGALPVRLVLPETPECGMKCCVRDNFCCCSSDEGHDGEPADAELDTTRMARAVASAGDCGGDCATAPSPTLSVAGLPPSARSFDADEGRPTLVARRARVAIDARRPDRSAPRAPPTLPSSFVA